MCHYFFLYFRSEISAIMNYIGSKHTLLPFLGQHITAIAGPDARRFCDLFAGTGTVGEYFKRLGYSIIANDFQYYSYALNRHYIGNNRRLTFENLGDEIPALQTLPPQSRESAVCKYLDDISGCEGFVYNNYCPGGTTDSEFQRLYFTDVNGQKCDAVRQKIEQWLHSGQINDDEYWFLMATLLENIDKVANTASVYGAFLKRFKYSACKKFEMQPAALIESDLQHHVYCEDANRLIRDIETDILYLDPPYNQRQYSANYHVLETIARYDEPALTGKTGMRDCRAQKSDYCSKSRVLERFEDIITHADAQFIFLSYNNEGLMSPECIRDIMSARGDYGCITTRYARFKADRNDARNHRADRTTEFLHYVICR